MVGGGSAALPLPHQSFFIYVVKKEAAQGRPFLLTNIKIGMCLGWRALRAPPQTFLSRQINREEEVLEERKPFGLSSNTLFTG